MNYDLLYNKQLFREGNSFMNRTFICCLIVIFGCFCFSGCASLDVGKMVPDQTSFGVQHSATVALKSSGGSSPFLSATIPPDKFGNAVKMSLEKSNLFKELVDETTADYILNVVLTYAGINSAFYMNAWVTAEWDLIDRASDKSVWSAEVSGQGGASVGEAFSGAKRQYMALERGAKANIEDALSQIGKLNLE